ncbi:flagellar hook-length control protein FliK [Salipaludibacillus sp. HK11]|uniref:flagellar hook-length control protein FliK n=1 Tax=Salipaludibacillus sp. HK11 TaxID=3394320 RepID=UPI0039FB9599
MNGMMAMMPLVSMNKGAKVDSTAMVALEGESKSSFIKALTSIMDGDKKVLKDGANEGQSLLSHNSLKELVDNLDEPLTELLGLIEQVALEDSFMSAETLQSDEIIQLMSVLPEDWQEELLSLFENHSSLEGIIEEFKSTGDPVTLITIVFSFSQMESEITVNEDSENAHQKVQELLSTYFPELIQNDENQSIQETLIHLSNFLANGDQFQQDSLLSQEMLEDEELEKLISVLPDEVLQELIALFENQTSLNEVLEEFTNTGEIAPLLALVASFSASGNGIKPEGENRAQHAIQQLISTYFPELSLNDKNQSTRQTLVQLTEFLASGDRSSSSSQLRSDVPLNTTRFAELAYMNQLASENAQTKSSNHSQPTSMLLDTTNSQMARFQAMVLPSGEATPERPSQEQFIRQFQHLLSRSTFQQFANGTQQLSMKLHPASLGRMDITIQQVNGVMMATLMTTTKVARDLMDGQLAQLRNAFQSQNIQVDKIEVTQQQQNLLHKDSNQDETKQQPENDTRDNELADDDDEDAEQFADLLENTINIEA